MFYHHTLSFKFLTRGNKDSNSSDDSPISKNRRRRIRAWEPIVLMSRQLPLARVYMVSVRWKRSSREEEELRKYRYVGGDSSIKHLGVEKAVIVNCSTWQVLQREMDETFKIKSRIIVF